jgi:hypothetical protein
MCTGVSPESMTGSSYSGLSLYHSPEESVLVELIHFVIHLFQEFCEKREHRDKLGKPCVSVNVLNLF